MINNSYGLVNVFTKKKNLLQDMMRKHDFYKNTRLVYNLNFSWGENLRMLTLWNNQIVIISFILKKKKVKPKAKTYSSIFTK